MSLRDLIYRGVAISMVGVGFIRPALLFPRTRESIILREELGGFKDPQNLTQLPEITNLEWEEWKEQGIIIAVE